jgi:hypothetical protein
LVVVLTILQGGMAATLGDLSTAYDLFSNKDEIEVDFLIMALVGS